jgi:hypothetical protein
LEEELGPVDTFRETGVRMERIGGTLLCLVEFEKVLELVVG